MKPQERKQRLQELPSFVLLFSSSEMLSSLSSSSILGFPLLTVSIFSVVLGGLLVLLLLSDYIWKKRSEVRAIASPEPKAITQKASRPPQKKGHLKHHPHAAEKDQVKRHHPLDVNTLKGHGDTVSGLCFSSDGRNLATACADGVARVFRLDDASSKSFKFLRLNLPAGNLPVAVAFSEEVSSLVVATQALTGSSLYMYGDVTQKPSSEAKQQQQQKLPLPEIKWEHHKVHERRNILTLSGATASYGAADGSTIIASCSEDTDIILWHGKSGKVLGTVDTNQLKNTMAALSPNGRFLAAAAFTADVKVWEMVYSKDGSVKEVTKVMQLKGHKSAVTWLCFTPNSEQIITTSKDGSMRIWNINVRYHLDEDPKTLKVFPIPLRDSKGSTLFYDHISISPDGKILAATHGSTLQWLCAETGNVFDTVDKAHEGDITGITWSPQSIPLGGGLAMILATAGTDKKVKLWEAPKLQSI